MKNSIYKILLFSSLLFLLPFFINAQTVCNNGQGITLNTQEAVDAFEANYGTCNNVNNLTISGADITNIDGLSNITIVSNTLRIQNLPNLENLNGLANLTRVRNLVIENCPKITNLDAFSNLTRITFEVRISANANLTSVAGLQNVTSNNPATTAPIRIIRIFNNPKLAACCTLYDFITHPNVQTVAVYGNASTCNQNSITADPANATINVVQNDNVIESGIICVGTATQLRVNNGFIYQWAADPSLSATDIANPTITPTENTTYSVTITGCNEQVATKTIDVTVLDYDRIYVKHDATGDNDGTSWENAFTELQSALNIPCTEREIWVAAGTYLPTEIPYDEHDGNERFKTFHLSKNVQLYGGFAGTETTLEERNPATNLTILDGNGGYHTLIATALTRATVIDGFTIKGGNAGGGGATSTYAGAEFTTFRGGGMLLNAASPTINNCIFKNNEASLGSAFTVRFESNPLLTNCLLANNTAKAGASAPSVVEVQTNSKPRFINCTITDNENGIAHRNNTVATYINTIIFANDANFAFYGSGTANIRNSLAEGSGGSSNWSLDDANDFGGNIDTDPKFVDSDNGDYSLKNTSPAFNFGNNADNTTATDLAGNTRIFNADNGGVIDLGAYELQELGFPEIAVEGNGTDIMHQDMTPSVDDNTDFGESRRKTFTIKNVGSEVLTLGADAVTITSAQATDFSVLTQPAVSIPVGGSTTFAINFRPNEIGISNATISINNNDSNEQPFEFAIQGTGTAANTGEEITIDGPFCNGCDDPQEDSSVACSAAGVNQIIQGIDVSDIESSFLIRSVDFNQESFDSAPSVTVNIFCGEAGTVPYTPNDTPIYSQIYQTKSADDGKCVNIEFDTPVLVDTQCGTTIWIEFRTTGGTRCVSTPASCNGVNATGRDTYIRAPGCSIDTPKTLRSEGFQIDAGFAINIVFPFRIEGDLAYCADDNTTVLSASGEWMNYLWSNDATTPTIEVSAGTYSVTVMDTGGITYSNEVTVVENANPQPSITGDLERCHDSNTTLDAGTWTSYLWSNDATTQTIEVGAGTYSVTVTDNNGCTGMDEVTIENCNTNTALDFDGQNDNVMVQGFIMPRSFTIEAMVNYTGSQNPTEAILAYNGNALFFGFDEGYLRLFGTDVQHLELFPTNVWKHVAVSFDDNSKYITLYVDGVQVSRRRKGNFNPFPDPTASSQLGLGAGLPGINGQLDEIRIWNRAISSDEVMQRSSCQLGGNEMGLELYFDFAEGIPMGDNHNTSTIYDKSPNQYIGTLEHFDLMGANSNFVSGSPMISELCAGSLAVEWLDFNTQSIDNQHIVLNWQVANEVATTHYEIERSADGKTFATIGKVNTIGDLYYQFLDKNPLRGDNYYRIREVENSGRFSFSETKLVQLKSTATTLLVYPNPTTDVVHLQLPLAETDNAVLTLIDVHGKTILQQKWSPQLDVHLLSNGIYFLRVQTKNGSYEQRIIKQ